MIKVLMNFVPNRNEYTVYIESNKTGITRNNIAPYPLVEYTVCRMSNYNFPQQKN